MAPNLCVYRQWSERQYGFVDTLTDSAEMREFCQSAPACLVDLGCMATAAQGEGWDSGTKCWEVGIFGPFGKEMLGLSRIS